jgi:A/G-specific adenine glycosylase
MCEWQPLVENLVARRIKEGFFVDWYSNQGRSFPWREPGVTPFGILVVEILLRQTKAEMVAKVWPGLLGAYPCPTALVDSNRKALRAMIAGLGFGTQRTEALYSICQVLEKEHQGVVPSRIEDLQNLPHLGIYSSHAIACFAFDAQVAVVDSNVKRLLERLFGLSLVPDIRRARDAWDIAAALLAPGNAKAHNYGLLDFTATMCKSRRPLCEECPLANGCASAKYGKEKTNGAPSARAR